MRIQGAKVAVIIADGFEKYQFSIPVESLRAAGAQVDVLAESDEKLHSTIQSLRFITPGEKVVAQRTILSALPVEYNGLLIPGGVVSCDQMRESLLHLGFVKHFMEFSKPLAAIGHAGNILADAEVIQGKTLTSVSSIRKTLERAGAIWLDREVIVDDNLITSRGTPDVSVFARAFIEQLAQTSYDSRKRSRAA